MFSFFRKKPPPAEPAAGADRDAAAANRPESDAVAAPAPAPAPAPAVDRPKTALEWLNTDISELFVRKKPAPTDDAEPDRQDTLPPVEREAAPAVQPPTAAQPTEAVEAERRAWALKLRSGLRKTGSNIAQAFVGATLDDDMYEDLEAALLQADAGAAATKHLLDDLQRRVSRSEFRDPAAVRRLLARCIADLLAPLEQPLVIGEHQPTVIMVVGVNGAGKTTSVGKLARHLIDLDQTVLLAAADTFRAAAREQLLAWAERAGAGPGDGATANGAGAGASSRIEIVSRQGGDPAGLTFDAVTAGKAKGVDVVIADTAGRLATQAHLMEELKKIKRTIGKAQAGAPHEVLLVIDGNTGQNALTQAQAFDAVLDLTGLVVTKLDGTAKGGVLAAIALWSRSRSRPLPVYYVGVGEKLADLQTFRADEFADALVS